MTQSDKQNNPSPSGIGGRLAIFALLALIALGVFWFLKNGGGTAPNPVDDTNGGRGIADAGDLQKQLTELRSALAATENIEPEEAAPLWDGLLAQRGDDASIALNRALNRVLRVDQLAETATSPLAKDDEKKAARTQFTPAADLALAAVDDFTKLSDDTVTSVWLKGRIDLHKAELIPVLGKSIRRKVFDGIVDMLASDRGKDPRAMILGGPLTRVIEEMEDPIDGLPESMLPRAATVVGELSDQHPDNLFLAIRAAQLNIANKDANAKTFTERTYDLSKAIEPALSVSTKAVGLSPKELVDEVLTSIDKKDFDTAGSRILQWFNVTNPTEIMKTDRRRVAPHPLDRLSFDSLRALSADAVKLKPLDKGNAKLTFKANAIDGAKDTAVCTPIDFDLDLDDDLVSVSKSGLVQLWRNDGGKWSAAGKVNLGAKPTGILVADLFMVDSSNPQRIKTFAEKSAAGDTKKADDFSADRRHNTFPGLIFYDDSGMKLISIDGRKTTADDKRISIVQQASGLEDVPGITDIVTGDLEGDGDLDLAVATKANGLRIFVNRGNRTFFETDLHQGGFALNDPIARMAIADIDRDLDLDIITVHSGSGKVGVLENLLHLQFRGRTLDDIPAIKNASSIAVADVDGNVSWDLVIGGAEKTAVAFSHTADAGIWTVDRVEESATPGSGFLIADLDNDSWTELVTSGGVMRIGPWGIEAPTEIDSLPEFGQLDVGDVNGDGLLDVISVGDQLTVATNATDSDSHHLFVRFLGQADNNARSGRVNHFGIGSVLELRFGPHYRSQIVTRPATHFGLDGFDAASSVRVIMPNGLTQTIRAPSVDAIVEEKQTLKGSCPYLYAWDGEKFVFQTDCLWAAPLGLQVARGVVAKDRPWEYLKIAGDQIQPRDGKYHFRITEELWEVAYFDKIALTAVDHPANVDVWTNEKVGPGNIAKQTLFAFGPDDLRPLQRAVDSSGRDATKTLADRDRNFAQGFDRRLRQGLCPPHWIDMDFGDTKINDGDAVYLVITGWILPTDTSLNIQIDQNPEIGPIEFPSVWVPDATATDGWRKAIPFMGFPGGKTKTIVVDVTEQIVKEDPRLRVRTSAQIYWDSAKLAVQSNIPETRSHDLDLLTASVAYHGFSDRLKESDRHPEVYDYQKTTASPIWPPLRGGLTRFGDCIDLVRQWDDSMVVISSGDEIQLTFSVPETPVPNGWKRDFVLHSVGWDKDADLNTLSGQMTGPLPFRSMEAYPPTVAMAKQMQKVDQLNASHLRRQQSFRAFWSRESGEDAVPKFLSPAR